MRLASLIALMSLVGSGLAAEPEIMGHVSPKDVPEICREVFRATGERVKTISSVWSDHYVPGATPGYWDLTTANGFKKVKRYERKDQVDVMIGSKHASSGSAYRLQKTRGNWKMLQEKGSWIY
jgi:hypothetical protein